MTLQTYQTVQQLEKALNCSMEDIMALSKAPASVNADTMSSDEIHAKLQVGLESAEKGRTQDVREAFDAFRGNLFAEIKWEE